MDGLYEGEALLLSAVVSQGCHVPVLEFLENKFGCYLNASSATWPASFKTTGSVALVSFRHHSASLKPAWPRAQCFL